MKQIIMVLAIMGVVTSASADDKAPAKQRLVWNNLQTNIIGRTPAEVQQEIKDRGLNWEVRPDSCETAQQEVCKEKFGTYCKCVSFADTIDGKNFEAKTYTAVVRDEKIVDYKMKSALIPANLWKGSKEEVAPLRVSAFANGQKPRNVHFDSIIPFGDRMPVVKDPDQVARYIAQWTVGDVEVAAIMWCSHRPRKKFSGKLRDCFISEASFSQFRKFNIPKGTEEYAY